MKGQYQNKSVCVEEKAVDCVSDWVHVSCLYMLVWLQQWLS